MRWNHNSLSRSTHYHGSSSDCDWSMTISILIQVIQPSPWLILKFRNKPRVQRADYVCCIRTVGCWVFHNIAKQNDYFVYSIFKVIFWDLLCVREIREIRSVRPFHRINIQKLCLVGTALWREFITSGGQSFSFVLCKA